MMMMMMMIIIYRVKNKKIKKVPLKKYRNKIHERTNEFTRVRSPLGVISRVSPSASKVYLRIWDTSDELYLYIPANTSGAALRECVAVDSVLTLDS